MRTAAAQRYAAHVRVRFNELDPLGHVNNAAYVTFLEQAAIDHAAFAGFDLERTKALGGFFVARRHEIDFLRPATAGDVLRVETWVEEARGARAVRRYEVRQLSGTADGRGVPADGPVAPGLPSLAGDVVLRACTEWAFVDPDQGRPRRIPEAVMVWLDEQQADGTSPPAEGEGPSSTSAATAEDGPERGPGD